MPISDGSSDVCSSELCPDHRAARGPQARRRFAHGATARGDAKRRHAEDEPVNLVSKHVPSPVGPLLLGADDEFLRLIWFSTPRHPLPRSVALARGDNAVLRETGAQLEAYFTGALQAFDLPLKPIGTAFQREVWSTLAEIPYGETWSYGDVARRIGKPQAVRAVGAANGRNPIPIVLHCHRVIGADGSLSGFGAGLPAKQFLLTMEGARPEIGRAQV